MVHPGQHIREVEHNKITVVDPRKAYDLFAFDPALFLMHRGHTDL